MYIDDIQMTNSYSKLIKSISVIENTYAFYKYWLIKDILEVKTNTICIYLLLF